jgi:hypothetical protein
MLDEIRHFHFLIRIAKAEVYLLRIDPWNMRGEINRPGS